MNQAEKERGEKPACQGTGDGDVEFLNGFGRIALDAGDSAKDEQSDRENTNFIVLRDHTMGKFMEEERSKKENASENAYDPLLGRGPARILLRELHGERIGDSCKNDDPCRMEKDGYPEDLADAHSGAWRHVE